MKNYVFTLIFILCAIFNSAYAQNNSDSKSTATNYQFGIEGGFNFVDYIGNGDLFYLSEQTGIIGGDIGAYLNITTGGKFSFQPEILFSLKGGKTAFYTSDNPYQSASYSVNTETDHLFCIELPLQIKYDMNKRFYLLAGPYIDVMFGGIISMQNTITNNGATIVYPAHSQPYNVIGEGINSIIGIGGLVNIGLNLRNNFNLGVKFSKGSFYTLSSAPLKNISAGIYAAYNLK